MDLHRLTHLPAVGLAGEVVDPQLVPLDGLGQGLVAGFHPLVRSPGKLDLVKMIVWNTRRVIHCLYLPTNDSFLSNHRV